MVAAKRAGVALIGAGASVEALSNGLAGVVGVTAGDAGTVLAQLVPPDTITQPTLRERLFCCRLSKGLKVLSCKSRPLHEDEGVYVPVRRVVIVDGSNELNLLA